EDHCRRNLRHFLNKLNKRVFRNGARAGRSLWCFAVLEGGNDYGCWHYHLDLELPSGLEIDCFSDLIVRLWVGTHWGGTHVAVTPADLRWLDYILKFTTKGEYDLSIDWENTRNRAV